MKNGCESAVSIEGGELYFLSMYERFLHVDTHICTTDGARVGGLSLLKAVGAAWKAIHWLEINTCTCLL